MLIKSLLSGLINAIHYSLLLWTDVLNYSWYRIVLIVYLITLLQPKKYPHLKWRKSTQISKVFPAQYFLRRISIKWCDCLILNMFLLIILCNYFNFTSSITWQLQSMGIWESLIPNSLFQIIYRCILWRRAFLKILLKIKIDDT